MVPTRLSLSIGIILNELLTNAVKYAFAPGSDPRIMISIGRNRESEAIELTVADNGRGLPEEVVEGRRRGYGLTIVESLVKQHKGVLELGGKNGAYIRITLRDNG